MIDFPIAELLDDNICLLWLERHLHPEGLTYPRCGHPERRLFRVQGSFPAYRCRACQGYYTLLTGTVFAKTRQRPATLVLLCGASPQVNRLRVSLVNWGCPASHCTRCDTACRRTYMRRRPPT